MSLCVRFENFNDPIKKFLNFIIGTICKLPYERLRFFLCKLNDKILLIQTLHPLEVSHTKLEEGELQQIQSTSKPSFVGIEQLLETINNSYF